MPFTSFCELPRDDHLTFIPAVMLVYHPSCATACASKHVVSARWHTNSFYLCGSRSSESKIWANMDRSWWPDCLACMFTRPDSARLLPVGSHEELGLRDPVDPGEDLLTLVMAAADVRLLCIGDCTYENMVRRYRVFVEVAGHHIEPFL